MPRLVSQALKHCLILSALTLVNCGSSSTTTTTAAETGGGSGVGGGSNGGSSSTSSGVDSFVGVWQFTSGSQTPTCTGLPVSASALSGTIQISKGTTAPLIAVIQTCTMHFDVNGTSANAQAAQTCTETGTLANGTAYSETDTYTVLTFTTTDGKNAHVSGSYNAVLNAAGTSYNCTVAVTGDLQKQ